MDVVCKDVLLANDNAVDPPRTRSGLYFILQIPSAAAVDGGGNAWLVEMRMRNMIATLEMRRLLRHRLS